MLSRRSFLQLGSVLPFLNGCMSYNFNVYEPKLIKGDVIDILKDTTLSRDYIGTHFVIHEGATLDLNGHTLFGKIPSGHTDRAFSLAGSGSTIKNGSYIMSLDAAGNYLFEVGGSQYRVMKMDVFKQRDFIGVMKKTFISDENGDAQIELYSQSANDAQDYLFPLISVKDGADSWVALMPTALSNHLETLSGNPLNAMNEIFSAVVGDLIENFTGTGEESRLQTSSLEQGSDSSKAGTLGPLAQTLSK